MLEACVHEKFNEFSGVMDVNDIVQIARLLFRGPEFDSLTIASRLEEFLLANQDRYIGGLKQAHESGFRDNYEAFNKCLIYLEGTL